MGCSLRPLMDAMRSALPASEVAKLELRDEAEFIILRLNTASRHIKHSLHMYTRDAIHCVREGEDGIARQLLGQKLLMEQRADSIRVNLELLESVRTSLQPGLPRCRGDMQTCRTILDRCSLACMAPEVVTFMDMCTPVHDGALDGADHDPSTPLSDRVPSQAIDEEFERLKSTVRKPLKAAFVNAGVDDGRMDEGSGAMDGGGSSTERADLLLLPHSPAMWTDRDLAAAAAASCAQRALSSEDPAGNHGDCEGLLPAGPTEGVLVQLGEEGDIGPLSSEQHANISVEPCMAAPISTAADGAVAPSIRGALPTARQLVFDKQV